MPRASLSAGAGRLAVFLLGVACVSPSFEPAAGSVGEASSVRLEGPAAPRRPAGGARGRGGSPARVRLPATASEFMAIEGQGVALGVKLARAQASAAQLTGEQATYEGALGEGTALRLAPRGDGVEDVVTFAARPAAEQVEYALDVRRVAGVRKIGQIVEFLDAGGAPRLRMEAPYIEGADGRIAQADVEVGCAYDESPRAPWGRPVVAPGAEECRVTVRWEGRGVQYPAALDPVWTSAQSMTQGRVYPAYGRTDGGRLVVAGGEACVSGSCNYLKHSEVYDLVSGTWAQTGSTNDFHGTPASLAVPGFGVMVIGGRGAQANASVERYDEGSGSWVAQPSMSVARQEAMVGLLPDQKTVLVAGGNDSKAGTTTNSVELFDTSTQSWVDGGKMNYGRYLASMTRLPDGKFLIAGGTICGNCGPVPVAEIYDASTKTSELIDDMPFAHFAQQAVLLQVQGKPQVLIAGGGSLASELFDTTTRKWTSTGDMLEPLVYASSALLPDGSFLVAGGAVVPVFEATFLAERYDPVEQVWKAAGNASTGHIIAASLLLDDGRFLVAGGAKNNFLVGTDTVADVDVFQQIGPAEACSSDGECSTLHCVDGVCCDTACDGLCEGCAAAKTGGLDGICAPITADSDPDGDCVAEEKSTCGQTGFCDGKKACARYATNTPCGPAACTNNVSTGLLCNKEGKCQQQVVACAPFICKDPTACATDCDSDDQCAATAHCEQKGCAEDLPNGSPCTRSPECQSERCVDGVCCDSDCKGTCQACAAALKQAGPDGVCGPAKVNTDPRDSCADEPVAGCDRNGLCDGKGACALYDAGTVCQPEVCSGDAKAGFRVDGFACDGSGTCTAKAGVSCGLFGCDQGACRVGCASDSECVSGAYCQGSACVARKNLGQTCTASRECLDGFCVDGVCCSGPCDGRCEACNTPGAPGFCVPVSGSPQGGRPACDAAPAGQPCQQRVCDGVVRENCAGFVGTSVQCRAASCADSVATLAASCDGKGNCPAVEVARCEPFVCGATACATACASDADCDIRFQCDTAAGDCVPRTEAVCDGAHTLINPDGNKTDCAPYNCEGAACKATCASVLDCVLPNVCDESSKACVPPRPNPSDPGCQAAPGPVGASPLAGLAWLALAAAWRGRPGRSGRRGGRLGSAVRGPHGEDLLPVRRRS